MIRSAVDFNSQVDAFHPLGQSLRGLVDPRKSNKIRRNAIIRANKAIASRSLKWHGWISSHGMNHRTEYVSNPRLHKRQFELQIVMKTIDGRTYWGSPIPKANQPKRTQHAPVQLRAVFLPIGQQR